MNRRNILKSLAGLALCPVCSSIGFSAEAVHWGYEGAGGPAKWGNIDAASKVCSVGSQQSPIDLGVALPSQLPPLEITWSKTADTIINNGHTIQLDFSPGNTVVFGSGPYILLQVHFHRPSEHLIGGRNFPMEAHFVHRNADGGLAVIGALLAQGKSNAVFSKIVSTMPASAGPAIKADPAIDPNALLPAQRSYYRYAGSLTTPPCSEIVEWLVLTDTMEIAETDVAKFAKLYPMNARPVQKDNRRYVLRSS